MISVLFVILIKGSARRGPHTFTMPSRAAPFRDSIVIKIWWSDLITHKTLTLSDIISWVFLAPFEYVPYVHSL